MKKSLIKVVIFSFLILFCGRSVSAQIAILDKLSPSVVKDTTKADQKISLDNLNREIEFSDNLIVSTNISDFTDNEQKRLIAEIDTFSNSIIRQGSEFRIFESEKLSHFFLINAKFNWREYYSALRDYQGDLQKMLRDVQEKQSYYLKNRRRWKISYPELEFSLSNQIKNHIQSNLQKIDKIIADYDLMISKLSSTENKIIQDILFADGILKEISNLQQQRKAELFRQNDKNIFSVSYGKSYSGSFSEQIKLAFSESTKTFGYFYSSVKRNFIALAFFILVLIFTFYFIRRNYIQLNYDESHPGFFRINRIVVQKPVLTLVALVLFLWTIFVPYSPLVLMLIIYLSTLIIIFLILGPVIDPFIRKIEIAVIILLTMSNLQLFSWYFGNYSRFYLVLESMAGIILTYKYILPGYKVKEFRYQNKSLILTTRIITLFIFIYYTVAFVSNIAGFLNLAVYSLKLGVYTGVISLLAHGFYRIISSIFLAGVDVFNIYYPEIVRKYKESIISKLNRFLKIILGFLWFMGIFRIAEVYEFFSAKFIAFFTETVNIGSLSFTTGNLLLFISILYFTYITASLTKRILEREILAKHKMKRGLAASISLTIRIFLVFSGTLLALSVSGLDMSKIGIIAGALSVGIGFGLQNVVSNFISGLILVYEKPVQEGDTVEVEALLGRVSNIGIRSSTIITYDGAEVVVPNSNLISNQLINWTLSDNKKRIEVKVGTSYSSNPHVVLQLLLKAALSNEKVLKEPEPIPIFDGFGDSSLNFRLLFWVPFEVGVITKSEVAVKIYDIFKENNIEIPFPQLDLHVKNSMKDQEEKNES